MNDFISRRKAVLALLKETHKDGAYGYLNAKQAENVIMALPAEQQWIPVSERLPESIEGVLVCGREALSNSVIYSVKWYDNGVWRPLSAPSCSWEAWMPLPESFYGNENGK